MTFSFAFAFALLVHCRGKISVWVLACAFLCGCVHWGNLRFSGPMSRLWRSGPLLGPAFGFGASCLCVQLLCLHGGSPLACRLNHPASRLGCPGGGLGPSVPPGGGTPATPPTTHFCFGLGFSGIHFCTLFLSFFFVLFFSWLAPFFFQPARACKEARPRGSPLPRADGEGTAPTPPPPRILPSTRLPGVREQICNILSLIRPLAHAWVLPAPPPPRSGGAKTTFSWPVHSGNWFGATPPPHTAGGLKSG